MYKIKQTGSTRGIRYIEKGCRSYERQMRWKWIANGEHNRITITKDWSGVFAILDWRSLQRSNLMEFFDPHVMKVGPVKPSAIAIPLRFKKKKKIEHHFVCVDICMNKDINVDGFSHLKIYTVYIPSFLNCATSKK